MDNRRSRWKIQMLATFLSNPFLNNFVTGKIYKGRLKSICLPGLNCYSCPGAAGGCPIGSLQALIGSPEYMISYYVLGFLIITGVMLGRLVCGFLCPFGWFQELLHKIPSTKYNTNKFHFLTKAKYGILLLFVIILPMTLVNEVGMGNPYFCKYLCPVGVLEGAIPLAIANSSIRASLGWLFTWKACLLVVIMVMSIFFYRPFCKWFCPLGAFYALFNKISIYRFHLNKSACTNCGACNRVCKMNVNIMKDPNHSECIRCGDCIAACPHQALTQIFTLNQGDTNEKNL